MRKYYVRDILSLILGIILFAFGIIFVLESFNTELHPVIAIQIASLILLGGLSLLFVGFYYFVKSNLINWSITIGGATFVALSICVFTNPMFLLDIISVFLSVFFFVAAIACSIYALNGLVKKTLFFTPILAILVAITLVAVGVLLLVEEYISNINFVLIVLGVLSGLIGLIAIVLSILDIKRLNNKKTAIENEVIIDDSNVK